MHDGDWYRGTEHDAKSLQGSRRGLDRRNRAEEALASGNHNEAQLDQWEAACFRQKDAQGIADAAKKSYEGALRQEFFNF